MAKPSVTVGRVYSALLQTLLTTERGFTIIDPASRESQKQTGKLAKQLGLVMSEVVTDKRDGAEVLGITSDAANHLGGAELQAGGYHSPKFPNRAIYFITKLNPKGVQICLVTVIDRAKRGEAVYVNALEFFEKIQDKTAKTPQAVYEAFDECKKASMSDHLRATITGTSPYVQ